MRLRNIAKETLYNSLHSMGATAYCRHSLPPGFLLLTYHSFQREQKPVSTFSQPIHLFARQIDYLKAHYSIQPLYDIVTGLRDQIDFCAGFKKPPVAITVDDGYLDNYKLMFPVVKQKQIPVTVFLSTDFLDSGRVLWAVRIREIIMHTSLTKLKGPIDLDLQTPKERARATQILKEFLAPIEPSRRLEIIEEMAAELKVDRQSKFRSLTWSQVREMMGCGISFGSHTAHHSILTKVPKDVMYKEITDSRDRMEAETGHQPKLFSYPNGNYDDDVANCLRRAGYQAAVTQDPGINLPDSDFFRLGRIQIPHNESLGTFACRVSMVPRFFETKRSRTYLSTER